MQNQKKGHNLVFEGFAYKKEATFKQSCNWICVNGNGKLTAADKCLARCITRVGGDIKLGKHRHNHPPKYGEEIILNIV